MQWCTKATTMVPKVYLHLHSVIKARTVFRWMGWDPFLSFVRRRRAIARNCEFGFGAKMDDRVITKLARRDGR